MEKVVLTIVLLVVIFLVCREVVCWYFKINHQLALLTEIRDLLRKQAADRLPPGP